MKPDRPITFSTRRMTIGEMLDAQKSGSGDIAALVRLFVARSDITEEEFLCLDGDELEELTKGFTDSIDQSNMLYQLGRSLDGR